jgi:hypothetical protein
MSSKFKKLLLSLRNIFIDEYVKKSYSQEGEDMILNRIFDGQKTGFYVDVGAHHPKRFSNTLFFYRMGWRGINIEPNPDTINLFKLNRSRDINVQCGVSNVEGTLKYYRFNESALNTFDGEMVKSRLESTSYQLTAEEFIPVVRLDTILKMHLPAHEVIDFL